MKDKDLKIKKRVDVINVNKVFFKPEVINDIKKKKISKKDPFYIIHSLMLEINKKNGSIDSWLKKLPINFIKIFVNALDNLKENESILDSKDLSEEYFSYLMGAITLIANKNNNNKGIATEEIPTAMRRLCIRMSPFVINDEMTQLDDDLKKIKFIKINTDKQNPWDLTKGSFEVNYYWKDKIKLEN